MKNQQIALGVCFSAVFFVISQAYAGNADVMNSGKTYQKKSNKPGTTQKIYQIKNDGTTDQSEVLQYHTSSGFKAYEDNDRDKTFGENERNIDLDEDGRAGEVEDAEDLNENGFIEVEGLADKDSDGTIENELVAPVDIDEDGSVGENELTDTDKMGLDSDSDGRENESEDALEDLDGDGNFGENELGDGRIGEFEKQLGTENVTKGQRVTVLNNMGSSSQLSSFKAAGQTRRSSYRVKKKPVKIADASEDRKAESSSKASEGQMTPQIKKRVLVSSEKPRKVSRN